MKKIFCSIVLLFVIVLLGCDEPVQYMKIEKKANDTKTLTYTFNTTGTIDQTQTLYPGQIIAALTNDLPNKFGRHSYTMTDLSIESMGVKIIENPDNKATSIDIGSLLIEGTFGYPISTDKNFALNSAAGAVADLALNFGALDKINTKLKAVVTATSGIGTPLPIVIKVKGKSNPSTSKASMTLQLNLKFTIEYWYCEETFPGFINPKDYDEAVCN
jgi:hypothetical protein